MALDRSEVLVQFKGYIFDLGTRRGILCSTMLSTVQHFYAPQEKIINNPEDLVDKKLIPNRQNKRKLTLWPPLGAKLMQLLMF